MRAIFPLTILLMNIGAALVYLLEGDYRRAVYWAASALCVAAITVE